jgi:uncharacterized protein
MDSAETTAASRLCAECGLCCNGVMFHTVRLQLLDSAKELTALGLKLKRKKGANYILQPCPAFRGSHCSIYESRPERCRVFECRQLERVAAGDTTEEAALDRIRDVQRRVREIEALLQQSGSTNPKRPLSKRYEKAVAVPLDASADPAALALRDQLELAMRELSALLDRDFRLIPMNPTDESES